MAQVARPPATRPQTTCYRAVVAYEGTRYFGFQRQAGNTPTIQGTLEAALEHVTRQPIRLRGAGRTDTGVHATGQVIAFDALWRHAPDALLRAINANLPGDIAVQFLAETHSGFHTRYDARSRTYEYTLYVAPVRQPLLNNFAWHVPASSLPNIEAMQQAAASLIGEFDFATFGQPPQGENTTRCVTRSEFSVTFGPQPGCQMVQYTIEANAFLYRMVRRITGALVRLGRGGLSLDEFEAAFRAADGSWPNQAAPARGLCLVKVTY
jgi:tRNA pseudouridine38-40 synthase